MYKCMVLSIEILCRCIYIVGYKHVYMHTFHGSISVSNDKRMWNRPCIYKMYGIFTVQNTTNFLNTGLWIIVAHNNASP
jgi:hypothetical protein